jgi:hypothetical protein
MDFMSMVLGRKGRAVWAETKTQALRWGCKNLALSLKKRFSSEVDFIYRKPDLEGALAGGDSDSAYYASSIDLEKFLRSHGMKIIKLYEPSTLRGRLMAMLFPRSTPSINMVSQKKGIGSNHNG